MNRIGMVVGVIGPLQQQMWENLVHEDFYTIPTIGIILCLIHVLVGVLFPRTGSPISR